MRLNKRNIFFIILGFVLSFNILVYATDGIDNEPNNSMSEAEIISFRGTNGEEKVVSAIGKISYSGDIDWYKIYLEEGFYGYTLTNNDTSSTSNIFGELPDDYDIYIYDSSSNFISGSTNSSTDPEESHFTVSSPGYYYIKVKGYNGAYDSNTNYKVMFMKGDAGLYMEGQRYRFYPIPFYGRYDDYHTYGVAYSYGSKDTMNEYKIKMDEANQYASSPLDSWNDYSSNHPRPGRFKSEYDAGDTSQSTWAGIDCSGYIWRCADASEIEYKVNNTQIGWIGTSNLNNYSTFVSLTNTKIGDIYNKPGSHVVFISRLAESEEDMYILHAFSNSLPDGRRVQETPISAISYGSYYRRSLDLN